MAPQRHKREMERLESAFETLKLREQEASARADIHLRNLNSALERERTANADLAAANARIAEMEELLAGYEDKDKEIELLEEKGLKALGHEERDQIGGTEEGGQYDGETHEEEEDGEEGVCNEEEDGGEIHEEEGAYDAGADEEIDCREYWDLVQHYDDLCQSYDELRKDHDFLKEHTEKNTGQWKEHFDELKGWYNEEKESCQTLQSQLTESVKLKDELNGKYLELIGSYKVLRQKYDNLKQRHRGKDEENKVALEAAKLSLEVASHTINQLLHTHK